MTILVTALGAASFFGATFGALLAAARRRAPGERGPGGGAPA